MFFSWGEDFHYWLDVHPSCKSYNITSLYDSIDWKFVAGNYKLGCWYVSFLDGYFHYLAVSLDINFFMTVVGRSTLKAHIFQIISFWTSYFEYPWTLPSPSTSGDRLEHIEMEMSFFFSIDRLQGHPTSYCKPISISYLNRRSGACFRSSIGF